MNEACVTSLSAVEQYRSQEFLRNLQSCGDVVPHRLGSAARMGTTSGKEFGVHSPSRATGDLTLAMRRNDQCNESSSCRNVGETVPCKTSGYASRDIYVVATGKLRKEIGKTSYGENQTICEHSLHRHGDRVEFTGCVPKHHGTNPPFKSEKQRFASEIALKSSQSQAYRSTQRRPLSARLPVHVFGECIGDKAAYHGAFLQQNQSNGLGVSYPKAPLKSSQNARPRSANLVTRSLDLNTGSQNDVRLSKSDNHALLKTDGQLYTGTNVCKVEKPAIEQARTLSSDWHIRLHSATTRQFRDYKPVDSGIKHSAHKSALLGKARSESGRKYAG